VLYCVEELRQVWPAVFGVLMGNANVPSERVGRPVGTEDRGVASNVVVTGDALEFSLVL